MSGPRCPAAKSIYRHLYHVRHAEEACRYAAQWRKNNPDKVASYSKSRSEYFSRLDVKSKMAERSRAWAQANRSKVSASSEAYRKRNKAQYAYYANQRRARKMQAQPAWLNEQDLISIQSMYEKAAELTRNTGVEHEVDHIVPLRGYTVCGLHVPWNLRVITKDENRRRPRVWKTDAEVQ